MTIAVDFSRRCRRSLLCAGVASSLVVLMGCAQTVPGEVDEAPGYLVALVNATAPVTNVSASQFCAGVLVNRMQVLTAAHCVKGRDAKSMDVIAGANNLCSTARVGGDRVAVKSIVSSDSFDAALLTLQRATDRVPAKIQDTMPEVSSISIAWGWGKDSVGGVPPCSAEGKALSVISLPNCEGAPGADSVGAICGVPAGKRNTCEGDSGGPLVAQNGRLQAITISGLGCGPDDPGVYLRASEVLVALDAGDG